MKLLSIFFIFLLMAISASAVRPDGDIKEGINASTAIDLELIVPDSQLDSFLLKIRTKERANEFIEINENALMSGVIVQIFLYTDDSEFPSVKSFVKTHSALLKKEFKKYKLDKDGNYIYPLNAVTSDIFEHIDEKSYFSLKGLSKIAIKLHFSKIFPAATGDTIFYKTNIIEFDKNILFQKYELFKKNKLMKCDPVLESIKAKLKSGESIR